MWGCSVGGLMGEGLGLELVLFEIGVLGRTYLWV